MNTIWLYFLLYTQNTNCVYNTLSIPFMTPNPSQNSFSTRLKAIGFIAGYNQVKRVRNDYIIILSVHKSTHFFGVICHFTRVIMMAQYLYYSIHQTKRTKTMKNSNQTTVILKALDMQLKALIENDLKNFRSTKNKTDQQASKQLMAA